MKFCPWYPLVDAAAHAPAGEGVLQLRIAEGLVEYPRGKSAMVHYEHAPNVLGAATALAGARGPEPVVWCRHLEIEPGEAIDYAAIYAKLLDEFIRRFGAPPGGVEP